MHLYIGLNPVGKHVLIFLLMKFPRLVFFMDHPRRLLVTQLILYKNKSGGSHLTDALQVGVSPITSPSPLESQRGEIRERIFLLFKIQSNCHFISIRYKLAELGQRTEPPISEFATVVYCPHFNVGCIWHSLNSKLTHHSSAL